MDFTSVGTVGSYVKSLKTVNNVENCAKDLSNINKSSSKDTADFSKQAREAAAVENSAAKASVEDPKDEEGSKSVSELIKDQMEKIDNMFSEKEYDRANDNRLNGIRAKMRSGLGLTYGEQQYLAQKDPNAYSNFQKTEFARKMFRCTLRSCRTKDDVNAMRLSNALSALSAYRKATRRGGDGSAVVGLNAALENEIRDFVKSPCFKRLPTAAECGKFDKELAKARKYEQEKKLAARRKANDKKKKIKKTPGDGKRTVAQVLASPTARKVLSSRAKNAYCTCAFAFDYSKKMNSKA